MNFENNTGEPALKEARAENGGKEGCSWSNAAQDCWSKSAAGAAAESGTRLVLVADNGNGEDKNHWMEGRVQHRLEEEAAKLGLDGSKASWDDVIKTRAEKGSADSATRVERMRQDEAKALGLPDNASWETVDIARVAARKAELENKFGQK
jgi:hypothetical protein